MSPRVRVVDVFADGPGGGNPAPVVLDAAGMSDDDMRGVATAHGHESGFVLPAPDGSGCDFALRFWVPGHEMPMCGHATVAATWLLRELGLLGADPAQIWTSSGVVTARTGAGGDIDISQPQGVVERLSAEAVAQVVDVLGVPDGALATRPVQNARTSRVKTLVPLTGVEVLDGLTPRLDDVEAVCDRIGSTGLYPYAASDEEQQVWDARQFPRSSGYPEDAATGIAAAALAFALLADQHVEVERPVVVRQGRAMGSPSRITVQLSRRDDGEVSGCWVGGPASLRP